MPVKIIKTKLLFLLIFISLVFVSNFNSCGGGGGGSGGGTTAGSQTGSIDGYAYVPVGSQPVASRTAAATTPAGYMPLTGAIVSVSCGATNKSATTDSNGYFSVSGLPAGSCSVTIQKSGYTTTQTTVNVSSGGTTSVGGSSGLTLPPSSSGSVKIASNVAGAEILIDGTSTNQSVPASREITFNNISPGSHTIKLMFSQYSVSSSQDITVAQGQTTETSFSLTINGGLEGNVYVPVGSRAASRSAMAAAPIVSGYMPIEGMDVAVSCGSFSAATQTDFFGYFSVSDIPAGDCGITISDASSVLYTGQAEVAYGQVTSIGASGTLKITPTSNTGSIQVTANKNYANIFIDGINTYIKTSSSSSVTINYISPGTHQVNIGLEGYEPSEVKSTNITVGGTASISFNLTETESSNFMEIYAIPVPVPVLPEPPEISNVTLSEVASGLKISATVTTHSQKKDDGQAAKLIVDPHILPNPPDVKSVYLFYYFNGNTNLQNHKLMSYNSGTDKWEETISSSEYSTGDSLTYYVAAVDSSGNVASEIPATNGLSLDSWNDNLTTPSVDNCNPAQNARVCGSAVALNGTQLCMDEYTVNDTIQDTCDVYLSDIEIDMLDIHGFSVGVDETYLYVKFGLPSTMNDYLYHVLLDGFVIYLINPDIYDPDPTDTRYENMYVLTHWPAAAFNDGPPTYSFFSGDCLTDPQRSVSSAHECAYNMYYGFTSGGYVSWQSNDLIIKIEKQGSKGIGGHYEGSFSIVGDSNKSVIIHIATKYRPYDDWWLTDTTPSLRLYERNYEYDIN